MFRTIVFSSCILCCSAHLLSEEQPPAVRIDLVDGTRLIGTLHQSTLQAKTSYGRFGIPYSSLRQFERQPNGQIRIDFNNGDELTVDPEFEFVECTTLFGDVRIRLKDMKAVRIRSQIHKNLPAADSLVAYYGFDWSDGDQFSNEVADELNATNFGAEWIRGGIRGGAIHFDGKSRLEIPHDSKLCPQSFTYAAWLYPTQNSTGYEMLMAKTDASSWHGGYGVCHMSGDTQRVRFFINGYTSQHKNIPLPVGQWTHLACVAEPTGLRVYINGDEIEADGRNATESAKEGFTPASSTHRIKHVNSPMTLGGDPAHSGWKGVMDEVAFYDSALSSQQIHELYEYSVEAAQMSQPKLSETPPSRIEEADRAGEAVE